MIANAQLPKQRRIGVLSSFSESEARTRSFLAAFRKRLEELGWQGGRTALPKLERLYQAVTNTINFDEIDQHQVARWSCRVDAFFVFGAFLLRRDAHRKLDCASHSGFPLDLSERKSSRSQVSLQSSRASPKRCAENVRVGRPSTQRVKVLDI